MLTVVLWASAFPAIRVGLGGLGVAGLSWLRLAIASLALAVIAPVLKVRLPALRDLPLIATRSPGSPWPPRRPRSSSYRQ